MLNKLDDWLVWNWREARHWLSVQLTALLGFVQVLYDLVPTLQGFVSEATFRYITITSLVLIIMGRVMKQEPK